MAISNKTNIYDELVWRELLYDSTPGVFKRLAGNPVTCYNGFDPTSPSLHVGNLIPITGLMRFQKYGHTPIAIIGGGTGMIGDPSGKSEERQLLDTNQVEENVEAIKLQLEKFLDINSKNNPAKLINNTDWLRQEKLIDFLRNVGKHFNVNNMLSKESVKGRLDRESGISFTEFSYQALQAYDFLMLHEKYGCELQTGGSDQWGNIIAGVNLIRKIHHNKNNSKGVVHGLVYPLITNSLGEKIGKSIGGNITINPKETSPYKFYQFFLNTADSDVIYYLKLFTDMSKKTIDTLEMITNSEPKKRSAQIALSENITTLVHGDSGLQTAMRVTKAFFSGDFNSLNPEETLDVLKGAPITQISKTLVEGEGIPFIELAFAAKMGASKSDVRRTVIQGGFYLNSLNVEDQNMKVQLSDFNKGTLLVIRRGKKNHSIVKIIE